ncbi:unnamed protein product [Didymodactylos carnosus]|uniref:Nitronate monooxygenase domain-containing protein n=1 Tax=Didymodactylos carnosus TaxID=1234261 RepID=A0A815IBA8_9BILA|nr:unnamed protein product [Didymodactylos carnosus]CAF4244248.1 unnamed protein product [Didymodactylos carnosus]
MGSAAVPSFVTRETDDCKNAKGPDGKKLRYGIGFITFLTAQNPLGFNISLNARPLAMSFSFGNASAMAKRARAAGIKVFSQVQRVEDAVAALEYSDAIICQGQEAGGHGEIGLSTSTIFKQVQKKLKQLKSNIPLLAAGGFGDEHGVVKALKWGASGVVMGTRFLATPEVYYTDAAKYRIIAAQYA